MVIIVRQGHPLDSERVKKCGNLGSRLESDPCVKGLVGFFFCKFHKMVNLLGQGRPLGSERVRNCGNVCSRLESDSCIKGPCWLFFF